MDAASEFNNPFAFVAEEFDDGDDSGPLP